MTDHERLARSLAPLYRITRELEPSALGRCFLADTTDDVCARLCVLHPAVRAEMRDPDAFVSALEHAGRATHPALLALLGAGATPDGDVYYATRTVAGESARERAGREGVLGAMETAAIGARTADALAAAHAHGVVHGAVTPDALVLSEDLVFVRDLGVHAALLASGIAPERAATLLGATSYAPPEIVAGAPEHRSDVYALGATLYELLTGKTPFGGRTTSYVIASVLTDETPVDGTPAAAGSSRRVTDTVLRAIEKAPEDRWPSAAAFARALRDEAPDAAEERTASEPASRIVPIVIAVVVALAVLFGWRLLMD